MSRLLDMNQEERNRILRRKMQFDKMLRRITDDGFQLLLLLKELGPLEKRTFTRKALEWGVDPFGFEATYNRCKTFALVRSTRLKGKKNYYVDVTEEGMALIQYSFKSLEIELKKTDQKT